MDEANVHLNEDRNMTDIQTREAAERALSEATTGGAELAAIAEAHRELWPQVLQHPNVYADLTEWIVRQAPELQETLSAAAPTSAGSRPRRRGLVITLSSIAAVAVIALIAVLFLVPRHGNSLLDRLAMLPVPGDVSIYSVSITDTARLEAAVGEPFPVGGDENDIAYWLSLAGIDFSTRVSLLPAGQLFATGGLEYEASAAVTLMKMSLTEGQSILTAYEGSFSSQRLDTALSQSQQGVWQQTAQSLWSIVDGTLYNASTILTDPMSALPEHTPTRDASLALDTDTVTLLSILEHAGAYTYSVTHSTDGRISAPRYEPYLGPGEDLIHTWGWGFGVNDDQQPTLTLVNQFDSADDAAANTATLERILTSDAPQNAGVESHWTTVQDGQLLVTTVTLVSGRVSELYNFI